MIVKNILLACLFFFIGHILVWFQLNGQFIWKGWKDNLFLVSGDHNEDGARVLNEYLQSLDCNKHIIIGMMANKLHEKYISYFKDIASLTTIDIPNQPNSISGKDLKEKFKSITNVQYQPDINQAIKSIDIKEGDLLLITGSLYLAGEVLNLN